VLRHVQQHLDLLGRPLRRLGPHQLRRLPRLHGHWLDHRLHRAVHLPPAAELAIHGLQRALQEVVALAAEHVEVLHLFSAQLLGHEPLQQSAQAPSVLATVQAVPRGGHHGDLHAVAEQAHYADGELFIVFKVTAIGVEGLVTVESDQLKVGPDCHDLREIQDVSNLVKCG
jgi:hypothetical protein